MRLRQLWCASALLLAIGIAGVSAAQRVENPSGGVGERRARYQRKVLVSRSPVLPADPTPATAQPAQPAPAPAADSSSPADSSPPAPAPTPAHSHAPAPAPTPAIALAPAADADSAESARATRSAAGKAQDRFMNYVSDYVNGVRTDNIPDWPKNPLKLDLSVYGDRGQGRSTVPVFVLPVPIPVKQECSASRDRPAKYDLYFDDDRRGPPPRKHDSDRDYYEPPRPYEREEYIDVRDYVKNLPNEKPRRRPIEEEPRRRPIEEEPRRRPIEEEPRRRPIEEEPRRRPIEEEPRRRPIEEEPRRRPIEEEPRRRPIEEEPRYRPIQEEPRRRPSNEKPRRPAYEDYLYPREEKPRRPSVVVESPVYVPSTPAPFSKPRMREPSISSPPNMHAGGPVNSKVLVQLYNAQQPTAPELPAVLTRHRRRAPPHPPLPPARPSDAPHTGGPPAPRFDRPLALHGSIRVERSDYTEFYTAWWDPVTGNSRVDFGDGATTTYRTMQAYRVRRAAMRDDRTGEKNVRRCSVMSERPAAATDLVAPMLPSEMQLFSFDGYFDLDGVQAEMWKHTESGRPGELGGARDEALTFRHEMLLSRRNDTLKPIKYSVAVDSSVVGADIERYEHRYHEVHELQPEENLFQFDTASQCDSLEETEDMSVVEPLREFTLIARDTKYDELFTKFIKDFERKYVDSTEEAVRKTILVHKSRFVSAGNRLGATFELELNFLSDRLDAEVGVLLGVEPDDLENIPAEGFPHERATLNELADRLPDEFDWRPRGGVSRVKYQGSCSSCWAFAVVGAVEGALFRKKSQLVPLSEQCLVDCAQPYGGNGCKNTWPSHAYEYTQDRGLPAEKEYIPYMARLLECQDKVVKPVTQISAHVNVTRHNVPALKVAISEHAPSVVIIDAKWQGFVMYKKGIFFDDRCSKKSHNHAVLAVGWGKDRGEAHFILKNSWSAAWGEGGYVRMHGPSNQCGVLELPSYPRLEDSDVLRPLAPLAEPAPASAKAP